MQWKVCLSVRSLKLTISWNPSRLRHITDSPKTEFSMFCPLISPASTGMVGLAFQLLQRLLRGGLLGGLSVTMRRFLGRNITGFWFSRILKQRKGYLFKNLQKFSRLCRNLPFNIMKMKVKNFKTPKLRLLSWHSKSIWKVRWFWAVISRSGKPVLTEED